MDYSSEDSAAVKSAVLEASRADLGFIYRLAYVSEASPLFGPDDLEDIGRKSKRRNAELDITGILVMDGRSILQILEGEEHSVNELYQRISRDPRHQSVHQVAGAQQGYRLLSSWSLVTGYTGGAPAGLRSDFLALHRKLKEQKELVDIAEEEVELLKVIALFGSVPL